MRGGDPGILLTDVGEISGPRATRHQIGRDADRPARVGDVDRLAAPVIRMDFHRGVYAAGGGAADQQG